MDLSGLKFWQWMIIGTLAGAAVGFAWSNLPNDLERTGDKDQFKVMVRNSVGAAARDQPAPVRNIVVRQPELDPSNVLVYPVTFDYIPPRSLRDWTRQLRINARTAKGSATKPAVAAEVPDAPAYVSSGIYATTPFDGNESIVEFLKNKNVPFSDRSGSGQYMPVYYGAASGFVLIGVLWPAAIQLMIAAGLVKPPPKKEKVAKHRTGEDVDEMLVKPTAAAVDPNALHKLNDEMEAHLAATLEGGGPSAAAEAPEEHVSTLMSGSGARSSSDPTERPAPQTPEEKKDFAGQYYPVARVVKKDGEAH